MSIFSKFKRSPYRLPFSPKDISGDGHGFLALFDADGTLWVGDVADDFTQYAIKQKLISGKLWNQYLKMYPRNPQKACEFLLKLYAGLSVVKMRSVVEEWWEKHAHRDWIALVLESLYYLSDKNYKIAIVTGSPTEILLPLEKFLPITKVLGMDMVSNEKGEWTGELDGISCFGQGKLQKVNSYFGDIPIVFSAGNSMEDIPLMESSSNIILSVYPNREFNLESIRRRYTILPRPISFLEEKKLELTD